eukprot:3943304-Pleurochrysis_carterae.AAC.1
MGLWFRVYRHCPPVRYHVGAAFKEWFAEQQASTTAGSYLGATKFQPTLCSARPMMTLTADCPCATQIWMPCLWPSCSTMTAWK